MKVPKLRFKEFSDSWEEKKLETFLKESKIKGDTGENAKKLTVKLWGKGVVEKKEVVQGSSATQYYIRKSGQLIYGKLDFLNGAFGIIPKELDNYQSTLDLPAFDINCDNVNSCFLLNKILQKNFYKKLGDTADGSRKAKRIHVDTFLDMQIAFPSLEEQEKIGNFLSSIDKKISLTEEKLNLFKSYKKGMLQKIFKQEIRFKDENGQDYPDWVEKRLGDLGEFYRGHSYTSNDVTESGLLVLRSNNIQENKIVYNDLQFVTKECKKEIILKDKDIIICMANGSKRLVGKSGEYKKNNLYKNITIGAFCSIFRTNYEIVKFLFQTKKYYDEIAFMLEGTNINNLKNSTLEEIIFNIPTSLEEQQKIANFLSSIDNKIENLSNELENLKLFKKGLLQKMFI